MILFNQISQTIDLIGNEKFKHDEIRIEINDNLFFF